MIGEAERVRAEILRAELIGRTQAVRGAKSIRTRLIGGPNLRRSSNLSGRQLSARRFIDRSALIYGACQTACIHRTAYAYAGLISRTGHTDAAWAGAWICQQRPILILQRPTGLIAETIRAGN